MSKITEITAFSIDDIKDNLFLADDGKLWTFGNKNAKGTMYQVPRCVEDQDRCTALNYVDDAGKQFQRRCKVRVAKYILQNDKLPDGVVVEDDDGELIAIGSNLFSLLNFNKLSHAYIQTDKKRTKPFMVRVVNPNGERVLRLTDSIDSAFTLRADMIEELWGDELRRLNLYDSYFNP